MTDLVSALEVGDRAAHSEGQGDGVVWQLALLPAADAEPLRLKASDLVTQPWSVEDREVVLSRTRRGDLDLVERDYRPEVLHARWTGANQLELEGRFLAPHGTPYELVLSAQGRRVEHAWPLRREQQRFTATLSPAAATTLAGVLPLPQDSWDLLVRRCGDPESTARVKVDHALLSRLPPAHSVSAKRMALMDVEYDSLALEVGPDLYNDESGAYNQRRIQELEFPAFLRRPVRDAVLFLSYGALQYSDSPRAIYEELAHRDTDLELLWSVADGQVELPEGLTPVRNRSREWYEAMARSRFVVTCAYRPLEAWVERRPDQVVLQTWHGPPFK
ncbi:MAG: CDP-glycerol glycerophosphotransferase family protein, partial [Actinomycetes bacterium]